MANLIFAFSPTHSCIFLYSLSHCPCFLYFFFSYFITRNTSGSLNHWKNHRMLVTNIAPCPWETPCYRCHWAKRTRVWVRRVHYKFLIWVSPLQIMLTLRPARHEATSSALSRPGGQGPKYPLMMQEVYFHFALQLSKSI